MFEQIKGEKVRGISPPPREIVLFPSALSSPADTLPVLFSFFLGGLENPIETDPLTRGSLCCGISNSLLFMLRLVISRENDDNVYFPHQKHIP